MQHKMIPLFSVPLFKTNIGPLDAIERTWIDSLEYPPKAVARDKSDEHLPMVNRGMHILNSGQLKNTKIKIQNALEYFTKTVMGVEQNFRITTSWINKIPKEDWIQQHSHANSVISGVYYIETTPNCSPIVFNKPFLYTNFIHQTVQITLIAWFAFLSQEDIMHEKHPGPISMLRKVHAICMHTTIHS